MSGLTDAHINSNCLFYLKGVGIYLNMSQSYENCYTSTKYVFGGYIGITSSLMSYFVSAGPVSNLELKSTKSDSPLTSSNISVKVSMEKLHVS